MRGGLSILRDRGSGASKNTTGGGERRPARCGNSRRTDRFEVGLPGRLITSLVRRTDAQRLVVTLERRPMRPKKKVHLHSSIARGRSKNFPSELRGRSCA